MARMGLAAMVLAVMVLMVPAETGQIVMDPAAMVLVVRIAVRVLPRRRQPV